MFAFDHKSNPTRHITFVKSNSHLPASLLSIILALSFAAFVLTNITRAAPTGIYTVTNLNASGTGSLYQAILNANANSGADVINFNVSGSIILTGTLPAIDDAVTIDGSGQAITISGANTYRVLSVNSGKTVAINALTIVNGECGPVVCSGGGLENSGLLTITNSTLSNNSAGGGGGGGGLYNDGSLNVINSVFSGNNADTTGGGIKNSGILNVISSTFSGNSISSGGAGGGIYNTNVVNVINSTFSGNNAFDGAGLYNGNVLTLLNSTFSNNTASDDGGGLNNSGATYVTGTTFISNTGSTNGGGVKNSGTLTVVNSTFINNSGSSGGGIENSGTLNMTNSTLSDNSAGAAGGDIANSSGTITLKNTLIANSSAGGNCSGISVISLGHNLDDDNTCGLNATGDLTNTNPLLGPLQNNGGSTWTMALLTGSPAINAGDNAGCPSTDQRGVPRPIGPRCDIGAYEFVRYTYLSVVMK